jgi:hypothetical protein
MTESTALPQTKQVQTCRPQNATFYKLVDFIADKYPKNPAYVRVYSAILRCAGDKNTCKPRVKTLAGMAKCSERTVEIATRTFRRDGLLLVAENRSKYGRQNSNTYTLQPLPTESYKKSVDNSEPDERSDFGDGRNDFAPSSKEPVLKTDVQPPPTPHSSAPTAQGGEGKKIGKVITGIWDREEIDWDSEEAITVWREWQPRRWPKKPRKERKPKTDYKAIAQEKYGCTPKGKSALGLCYEFKFSNWRGVDWKLLVDYKGTPLDLYALCDAIKGIWECGDIQSPGGVLNSRLKRYTPSGAWEQDKTAPHSPDLPAHDRTCGCRMGFAVIGGRKTPCRNCERGKAILANRKESSERKDTCKQLEKDWKAKWL